MLPPNDPWKMTESPYITLSGTLEMGSSETNNNNIVHDGWTVPWK